LRWRTKTVPDLRNERIKQETVLKNLCVNTQVDSSLKLNQQQPFAVPAGIVEVSKSGEDNLAPRRDEHQR